MTGGSDQLTFTAKLLHSEFPLVTFVTDVGELDALSQETPVAEILTAITTLVFNS